jgi:hypothetical protein
LGSVGCGDELDRDSFPREAFPGHPIGWPLGFGHFMVERQFA